MLMSALEKNKAEREGVLAEEGQVEVHFKQSNQIRHR